MTTKSISNSNNDVVLIVVNTNIIAQMLGKCSSTGNILVETSQLEERRMVMHNATLLMTDNDDDNLFLALSIFQLLLLAPTQKISRSKYDPGIIVKLFKTARKMLVNGKLVLEVVH